MKIGVGNVAPRGLDGRLVDIDARQLELRKTAGRAEPTDRLGSKPRVRTAVSGLRFAGCFVILDKGEGHLRLECSAKKQNTTVDKV